MKVPLNWLREYVDVTLPTAQLAERLTLAGLEVIGVRVFGAVARDAALTMPERHLGLVQAQEDPALLARLATLADLVERDVDLSALEAAAHPTRRQPPAAAPRMVPPGQRIALARDVAFSFVYPHLLQGWYAAVVATIMAAAVFFGVYSAVFGLIG